MTLIRLTHFLLKFLIIPNSTSFCLDSVQPNKQILIYEVHWESTENDHLKPKVTNDIKFIFLKEIIMLLL